jgi:hypothetical protein
LICMEISISSVLLQSSSFEITSGQWMFRILRKQRLTKVCSFEVVVFISLFLGMLHNRNWGFDCSILRQHVGTTLEVQAVRV